jgi:hypothetical protein
LEQKSEKKSVQIHYEKNSMYRTIFADGAIGGITPLNQVNLCFYATRQAIPKSVKFELGTDGKVGNPIEVSQDSKSGIIREVEIGVYMSRESAHDLYSFLKKIFEHEPK